MAIFTHIFFLLTGFLAGFLIKHKLKNKSVKDIKIKSPILEKDEDYPWYK